MLVARSAMLILPCLNTSTYYKVDYELIMLFGGTELKVQLAWKENVSSLFPFFPGCQANNGFSSCGKVKHCEDCVFQLNGSP